MDEESVFTVEQFRQLTDVQKTTLAALADYLTSTSLLLESLNDELLAEVFNLFKPCRGCVPEEEADENLLPTIRRKFAAVYQVGMELAEGELKAQTPESAKRCSFHAVIQPSYEDATQVVIVDYDRPICYLRESAKAWQFHFATLAELADEVSRVRDHLVCQVQWHAPTTPPHRIFISVEGGLVQEVTGVPAGVQVVVLDYDIEGVQADELETSPLDGQPCCLSEYDSTDPAASTP
jgi:hypothetical protein